MLIQRMVSVAEQVGHAVLYLLIGLSVISVGIVIERLVFFARRRIDAARLGRQLAGLLAQGQLDDARALLAGGRSVEATVLREALDYYPRGPEAFERVIASGLKERRRTFESGLMFLGTLGSNAPFVGLFGTVLGIVTAFKELATAAGSTGGMNNVMGGIAEALVATAVGIIVAIPAVVFYNYFQRQCVQIEENVETIGGLLLATLHGATHDAAHGTPSGPPAAHAAEPSTAAAAHGLLPATAMASVARPAEV
jgi:biopolymer transport protein ExbB/TolQ